MGRYTRLWRVVGVLFILANLGGAASAVAGGEWLHVATHVGLLLLAAGVMRGLAQRSEEESPLQVRQGDPRLDHLQQSLDAIAIEVERIGEAQRFNAKLQAERVGAKQ